MNFSEIKSSYCSLLSPDFLYIFLPYPQFQKHLISIQAGLTVSLSPEQHLFQLSGYHGNKWGSTRVEHVEFHIGRHDLCSYLCIRSHTGSAAAADDSLRYSLFDGRGSSMSVLLATVYLTRILKTAQPHSGHY